MPCTFGQRSARGAPRVFGDTGEAPRAEIYFKISVLLIADYGSSQFRQ
jgi:hypothetical protein